MIVIVEQKKNIEHWTGLWFSIEFIGSSKYIRKRSMFKVNSNVSKWQSSFCWQSSNALTISVRFGYHLSALEFRQSVHCTCYIVLESMGNLFRFEKFESIRYSCFKYVFCSTIKLKTTHDDTALFALIRKMGSNKKIPTKYVRLVTMCL